MKTLVKYSLLLLFMSQQCLTSDSSINMDFSDVKPTEKKLKNNIMSSINSTVNTKPIIEKQDNTSSSNSMFAGMAAKQSSNSMLKQDQSNQQSAISNNVDDTDVKTVATDTDNQEKNNNKNV